ncbi:MULTISPECIES: DUF6907 domain-containing protein [unclassified Streptomyces]|uniref:DUF6907 domain-containing protein n=1 Tax=unclassified Streptomyces TaxID=2593676 RepID=UPI000380CC85|nr:hypothetical protein [Streptomyces sp. LaPpAH-202]MYW61327.1 PE-PGRS family protein [Streptomyces sp. SID8370]MYW87274.1 PE-PGRS family protein [Streptomyces sp. SID8371]
MGNLPTPVNDRRDPLDAVLRAAFDAGEPCDADGQSLAEDRPAEDRTLTYPLVGGGFLAAACPSWCTADHETDLLGGVEPADLFHEGDRVAASFKVFGAERPVTLLEARITQEPYSNEPDARRPHVAFRPDPEAEVAADQYMTADGLNRLINQLTAYTVELTRLRDQLGQARAEAHAARHSWLTDQQPARLGRTADLRPEDARSMPVAYLLRAFGAEVVEDEPSAFGEGELATLSGAPGSMRIRLDRTLTQVLRESTVRNLLAQYLGGAR